MKTFALNIPLTQGLRAEDKRARNSNKLETLVNLVPSADGLASPQYIYDTFDLAAHETSWPFAQLMRGRKFTLLGEHNALYSYDELRERSTRIKTWELNGGVEEAIASGGSWHLADFGNTWFATNGASVVLHTNANALIGEENKTLVTNSQVFSSCCATHGRAFLGGIDPTTWVNTDWQTWLDAELARYNNGVVFSYEPDANFVYWSSLGGGDLLFNFIQSYGIDGYVGNANDQPFIVDYMKMNSMGFMPMRWRGPVLAVVPCGENVIAGGPNGISFLFHSMQPVATIGQRQLSQHGPLTRDTLFGCEAGAFFISGEAELWRIDTEGNLTKLGYKHLLSTLDVNDIRFAWNGARAELYILTPTRAFILGQNGLSETTTLVTSLGTIDSLLCGPKLASTLTQSFSLVTDVFDCGLRSIKRLQAVAIPYLAASDLRIRGHFSTVNGIWNTTAWVRLNDQGWGYLGIAGTDFRVEVTGTSTENTLLEQLQITYQLSDKRNVQGFGNANQA